MSIIKSFSVGNGDLFYINHGSDNFTVIDCNLQDDRKEEIMDEISNLGNAKGIMRFISTHPDEDHFHGIEYFDERFSIINFYCVKNEKLLKRDILNLWISTLQWDWREILILHFLVLRG